MANDTQKVDVLKVMEDCIDTQREVERVTGGQFGSTQAVADITEARAAVAELIHSLKSVLTYVVSDTLEHCDGNKCRECWCIGCSGEDYATECVAKANEASSSAYALLDRIGGAA